MGDGTVVEVSGDPELARRISYLADNLLAPLAEFADPPAGPVPALGPAEQTLVANPEPAQDVAASLSPAPQAADPVVLEQFEERDSDFRPPSAGWPQMRLVFSDGSEAALPPDQEIVDRLAYVVANLLPARPTA